MEGKKLELGKGQNGDFFSLVRSLKMKPHIR